MIVYLRESFNKDGAGAPEGDLWYAGVGVSKI